MRSSCDDDGANDPVRTFEGGAAGPELPILLLMLKFWKDGDAVRRGAICGLGDAVGGLCGEGGSGGARFST